MAIHSSQFGNPSPFPSPTELQSIQLSTSKLRNRRLLLPPPPQAEFFEREEPDIA